MLTSKDAACAAGIIKWRWGDAEGPGSIWEDQSTSQEQQDTYPQQSLGEFGGPTSKLQKSCGATGSRLHGWRPQVRLGKVISSCWCSQVPDQLQEAVYWPTNEFLPLADHPHLKKEIKNKKNVHFISILNLPGLVTGFYAYLW